MVRAMHKGWTGTVEGQTGGNVMLFGSILQTTDITASVNQSIKQPIIHQSINQAVDQSFYLRCCLRNYCNKFDNISILKWAQINVTLNPRNQEGLCLIQINRVYFMSRYSSPHSTMGMLKSCIASSSLDFWQIKINTMVTLFITRLRPIT